jgi:alkaline phosphatase
MLWICLLIVTAALFGCSSPSEPITTGNVIFIHPDGSGASMWAALRLATVGPDGMLNWDRLEGMGLYRGHVLDSSNASSQAGATAHAFGVKAPFKTYGINPDRPFTSASGQPHSILVEAIEAGYATALINSGHIAEPGTGVFAASWSKRTDYDPIVEQIVTSDVDIILSGGEYLLMPEGVVGRHGEEGRRKDGRNLIEEAAGLGYSVVYTRDELLALPNTVDRVLGVFAAKHTFNDEPEEVLAEAGLPLYKPDAPTLAEMTRKALQILATRDRPFFVVVEEEGSDNFGNDNNAAGTLEALRRADEAIGVALEHIEENPRTLLVTAADSDAGGLEVMAVRDSEAFDLPLPAVSPNGSPVDGRGGTETPPFVAAPDRNGRELRFGIVWAFDDDLAGGILARAHGFNADKLPRNVHNTDIYRLMYLTLFGHPPEDTAEHGAHSTEDQ